MPGTVRVLLVGIVLGLCAAVYVYSPSTAASGSFHNAVANSPAAGTIFLYPERIQLEAVYFFNAE